MGLWSLHLRRVLMFWKQLSLPKWQTTVKKKTALPRVASSQDPSAVNPFLQIHPILLITFPPTSMSTSEGLNRVAKSSVATIRSAPKILKMRSMEIFLVSESTTASFQKTQLKSKSMFTKRNRLSKTRLVQTRLKSQHWMMPSKLLEFRALKWQ